MSLDPSHAILARLRPLAVQLYAKSRGWELLPSPSERFWLFRHPEYSLRQLQVPMDADGVGFVEGMQDVLRRLAEIEARPPQAVLSDLQWPDADTLRVRVVNGECATGQLSLAADVALREGARRALLAAACSVINPVRFHPRLSRSEPDALLAACRAGQTEFGSYIVKIICPLHAVEGVEDGVPPFTRQVTTHLMGAVGTLVSRIEQGRLDDYEADDAGPLSWNLCDALLRMQPDRNEGRIDLMTTWAADRKLAPPSAADVPSRVSIKAEYLPEIEQVARILRPSAGIDREEQLIGTVEELAGAVGTDGCRSGEVVFSLLKKDGEELRARASLDSAQYSIAMRAHARGDAYIVLRGVIHQGRRICRIEPLRSVTLLEDPGRSS